jgi:hypothetical protein
MRLENLELRCWNYVVRTTLLELRCWNYVVKTALLQKLKQIFRVNSFCNRWVVAGKEG